MRIPHLVSLGALTLIVACGPGGPGPAPTGPAFSGRWWLLRTDSTPCGAGVELGLPVEFMQTGSDVSMTTPDTMFVGAASGSTATLDGRQVLVDAAPGAFVFYSMFVLERTGDTITGTARVQESVSSTGFPVRCEGTARVKFVPEMRLVRLNLDGVLAALLNEPLVFTFTQDVDLASVTPDTLQVTGATGPNFEVVAADGRFLALLPRNPNFSDFTDAGLAPGTTYTVTLTDYFDPSSIRSTAGARLAPSATSMFSTFATPMFDEPYRPLVHLPGPFAMPPGMGDEDGCLSNPGTSLYAAPGIQPGSDASDMLLCLVNEDAPHIIPEQCIPPHDERDVGFESMVTPGSYDLPAIRIRFNEFVNPQSVEAWDSASMLGLNAQLWRVGDVAGSPIPLTEANQVETNRPVVVQNLGMMEVILVATMAQPSGTYLINMRGLTDLPGNALVTADRPDPVPDGYAAIDAMLAGVVPDGYRYYFRTP